MLVYYKYNVFILRMIFKKYLLSFILLPALIVTISASFYRYVIANDYVVAFYGECDPASESCFVGCEDEACTEEYYYTIIERNAAEVLAICGNNVTECDFAYVCSTTSNSCSVTYCDPLTNDAATCASPSHFNI